MKITKTIVGALLLLSVTSFLAYAILLAAPDSGVAKWLIGKDELIYSKIFLEITAWGSLITALLIILTKK